jgi:hypothetical protein
MQLCYVVGESPLRMIHAGVSANVCAQKAPEIEGHSIACGSLMAG